MKQLKQNLHESVSSEKLALIIYTLTHGYLDDVEMEEILPYEKAFYRYLDTNEEANALIKEIEQTKDLPEQEKIDKVIKTFKLTR